MLHAYHNCCTNGTCNVFLWQSFRNHQIIRIKKVKPVLLKKKKNGSQLSMSKISSLPAHSVSENNAPSSLVQKYSTSPKII